MGDTYIQLVPKNLEDGSNGGMISKKIFYYLHTNQIIEADSKYLAMPEQTSYSPGERWLDATESSDKTFLGLDLNTVRIESGRAVFSANGVDEIKCPNCQFNIVDLEWGTLIEEWVNESGGDKLPCPNCETVNSISDFVFSPSWAFGNAAVSFWNWPSLSEKFLKSFSDYLGCELQIVYGKL